MSTRFVLYRAIDALVVVPLSSFCSAVLLLAVEVLTVPELPPLPPVLPVAVPAGVGASPL